MNMKQVKAKLFIPLVAGLLAVGSVAAYQLTQSKDLGPEQAFAESGIATSQQAGSTAPDFALKDVNGKIVHLSDFKGKVVVLNFWATWCPPCRREIPDFNEMQQKYGAQGVQFLGIALDDEGLSKVKPYLAANPIGYPILLPDANVVKSYGDMSAIPVTYIIDRQGAIRTSYIGARQKPVLEDMIKAALAAR